MSDYYTFRQTQILLRGEPAILVSKPGVWSWGEVNPGTAALIETMEIHPTDMALDMGCGTGVIGLAAARSAHRGWVTLVDVNIAATECARQTLAVNGIVNTTVRLGSGTDAVEAYDVILSHLPRGRVVVEELIRRAAIALKSGGRFYLVAHKRAGVKGAIDSAAQILGRARVVRQKKGYHVALAVKEHPHGLELTQRTGDDYRRREIAFDGAPTTLISCPGVFAWDRLDRGTAALVHAMEIKPGESVLDLGCGTGLLALSAARRGGHVIAVDADLRAVESATRTLAANQVDCEVLISDGVQATMDRRFDVVLCNPPFHQGVGVEYDVARQMVRDAATVLRPDGRLYLVSNAFIRYEREMTKRFARVVEVFNDRRYRVLRSGHR